MSFESNQVQDEKYTELIQNGIKEFEFPNHECSRLVKMGQDQSERS